MPPMDGERKRSGRTALLLVDVISAFDFDGGDRLLRFARRAAPRVRALRDAFARREAPVVYCNDNFGQWRSDFRQVIERCVAPDARGSDVAQLLRPREDDYFVLKPKHSAFFATPLDVLLRCLEVRAIVICGFAGDGCVLATALDAHMRDYRVSVAGDATASQSLARNRRALRDLAATEVADVAPAKTLAARIRRRTAT